MGPVLMEEANDPAMLAARPGAWLAEPGHPPRAAALAAEIARIDGTVAAQAAELRLFDEPAAFATALRELARP